MPCLGDAPREGEGKEHRLGKGDFKMVRGASSGQPR
jgi:hypothetical protein